MASTSEKSPTERNPPPPPPALDPPIRNPYSDLVSFFSRRRRRDRGDGSRGGRRGRRLPSLKNVSAVVSRSQSTSFSLHAAAKNPRSFCLKRNTTDLQDFLERRISFHGYNYSAAPPS
ncbi:unnamed protein product [Musa acuminata var. zebrina]